MIQRKKYTYIDVSGTALDLLTNSFGLSTRLDICIDGKHIEMLNDEVNETYEKIKSLEELWTEYTKSRKKDRYLDSEEVSEITAKNIYSYKDLEKRIRKIL